MSPPALALDVLAQRINRQQSALAALRQEYEKRQRQLAELSRRKLDLQRQLREVEASIAAIGRGRGLFGRPSGHAEAAVPATNLSTFLVSVLEENGGTMRVKDLVAETIRRNFPTKSNNIANLVQTRVKELVQRNVLRRLPRRRGVALGKAAKDLKKALPATPALPLSPLAGFPRRKPTLTDMLYEILHHTTEPIATRDLAARVQEAGYRTGSADFRNVVGVTLSRMRDVERIPGEGYRMRREEQKER